MLLFRTVALIALCGALGIATVSIGVSLALFTDTASVPGNTFTTAATFSSDDFADAFVIPEPLPYANSQSTVGATAEPGEPIPPSGQGCSTNMDVTVWYKHTPSSSQALTADTFGSDYDTQLIVWSGTSIDTVTFVGCNDDSGGLQSAVTFSANAGTTYYFQIDGFSGATGNLTFNLQASQGSSDDFADAFLTPEPLPYTNSQSTVGATAEPGEPIPPSGQGCSTNMDTTVWYKHTPSSSQTLIADTFGSDYDTQLIVWSGTSIGTVTFVGCNDDTVGLQAQVTFSASAGTTYYFQIDGFDGAIGNLTFNLQ